MKTKYYALFLFLLCLNQINATSRTYALLVSSSLYLSIDINATYKHFQSKKEKKKGKRNFALYYCKQLIQGKKIPGLLAGTGIIFSLLSLYSQQNATSRLPTDKILQTEKITKNDQSFQVTLLPALQQQGQECGIHAVFNMLLLIKNKKNDFNSEATKELFKKFREKTIQICKNKTSLSNTDIETLIFNEEILNCMDMNLGNLIGIPIIMNYPLQCFKLTAAKKIPAKKILDGQDTTRTPALNLNFDTNETEEERDDQGYTVYNLSDAEVIKNYPDEYIDIHALKHEKNIFFCWNQDGHWITLQIYTNDDGSKAIKGVDSSSNQTNINLNDQLIQTLITP